MKLLLVILLLAVSCVSGDDEQRFVLCGRQLANARYLLCYGQGTPSKRGFENTILDSLSEDNEIEWPWTGRRGALTADWSRYKREEEGLADQCCLRSCTVAVILMYC